MRALPPPARIVFPWAIERFEIVPMVGEVITRSLVDSYVRCALATAARAELMATSASTYFFSAALNV